MPIKRTSIPQVAVLVPLVLKGHLDVFRGVLHYAKQHGPWRLYRMEDRPGESRLRDLKRWGCTGIIAGVCNREEATLISTAGVPVVVVEPSPDMREPPHPLAKSPCSRVDSYAVGQLAARFFLDRSYTHFAFVGDSHDLYWSQERGQGFKDEISAAGLSCFFYPPPTPKERRDWAIEQPRMQGWLRALLKPAALFAAMDGRGRQVLDACSGANIDVPNEVAVLGVDDDELICEATFPTLSSIQLNCQQIGFRLAEHLDRLMRGVRMKPRVLTVVPTGVLTRQSTSVIAVADKRVAQALEYIWGEANHKAIRVSDVVRQLGCSRRLAETHFKRVMGQTISEQIQRVRLERVCSLLKETNLPISEITRQCGFLRESHLAFLFRKRLNTSMSDYRIATRKSLRS